MKSLARWCYQHRVVVLVGWLSILVVFYGASRMVGTDYRDNLNPPGSQSTRATHLLESTAPGGGGDSDRIVLAVSHGRVTDRSVRGRVEPMLGRIARLPHVTDVRSPYDTGARGQIATDGRIAFAIVNFDASAADLPTSAAKNVVSTARAIAGNGLRIALGGQAISKQNSPSLGPVYYGVLAAAIVLFLAFGSLLAMVLPLGTAVLSLGVSLGLIGLLSQVITMATFTTQLVSLIGLGVGVDYALFIVSRYRQGLLAGKDPEQATIDAVDTSGRSVLFAGITVCIALLGMFALGISLLYGVALATSSAVLLTMLAALTLQPALLGFFGRRVLGRRSRTATEGLSARWQAWTARLRRAPAASAAVGLLVIVIIAIPFFSLRLGFSDASNDPPSTTTRQSYDLLAKGFGPGFNGPLQVVAPARTTAQQHAFTGLIADMSRQHGVATATPTALLGSGGHRVASAVIYPTTAPQDAATTTLLHQLRDKAATAEPSLDVAIGGTTAVNEDFSHVLSTRLPIFIALVIGLSFLLLAVVFSSLLIPLLAAVMNVLSVGAAFGVVTAVFEWGWLGIANTGPIEPYIPVMVFAILFGLSMDYEVFLVSRMHEIWRQTGDNTAAVTGGLARTGRTITAAAAIMIVLFASFTLGDLRLIKLFGLGLASAVLIDVLIIRTLVLPALMLLLGRANWAMPSRLARSLPRIQVEPPPNDSQPLPDAAAVR